MTLGHIGAILWYLTYHRPLFIWCHWAWNIAFHVCLFFLLVNAYQGGEHSKILSVLLCVLIHLCAYVCICLFMPVCLSVAVCAMSEPCLQPSTTGGFEADSGTSSPSHDSVGTFCEIDGFEWAEEMVPGGQPLSALQNGVCLFSFAFTQLSFNQSLTDACLTHSSSQCFSWFLFVCEGPVVRWKNFVSLFPFHTVAVTAHNVY